MVRNSLSSTDKNNFYQNHYFYLFICIYSTYFYIYIYDIYVEHLIFWEQNAIKDRKILQETTPTNKLLCQSKTKTMKKFS